VKTLKAAVKYTWYQFASNGEMPPALGNYNCVISVVQQTVVTRCILVSEILKWKKVLQRPKLRWTHVLSSTKF
jgi:hypothetical protein